MVKSIDKDIEDDDIKCIFEIFDEDGSKSIELEELKKLLEENDVDFTYKILLKPEDF